MERFEAPIGPRAEGPITVTPPGRSIPPTTQCHVDALLIGGFVLLGLLAVRGHAWAFLVGVTLYALDGLISLLVHDWLGVGFHVFVVILILKGFQAARQLGTRAT